MTGATLFREVPSPDDPRLSQIQKNIIDALDLVAQSVAALAFPILYCAASAQLPSGRAVVVFTGNAGQVLTLPRAAAQGAGVSALIVLINTSLVTVTVARAGSDTIQPGGASIARPTNSSAIFIGDGIGKWVVK